MKSDERTFTVTARHHFDAAHRLPSHPGKCSHLHGHRWLVDVEVAGELNAEGMVMDFGLVKGHLRSLLDENLDHATLVSQGDGDLLAYMQQQQFRHVILPCEPTAENLAREIMGLLLDDLPGLVAVTVYETPTNRATVRRSR